MPTRRYTNAAPIALIAVALTACAPAVPPSTGNEHSDVLSHVHAIVSAPDGDGFLLGTHDGIYAATANGELGASVGSYRFDAMGLTGRGDQLIASGHPGRNTPAELGQGNLGIIRSEDGGQSWESMSFGGEKDFHSLATAPDGTLYGQATDSSRILASVDSGATWSPTGGDLLTFGLAVDATGGVIAVTSDGLQYSTDQGATFSPIADAPRLYLVASSPDARRLVGVDTRGTIWADTDGGAWISVGTVHGPAQAIATTDSGDVLIVDDSGLSLLSENP